MPTSWTNTELTVSKSALELSTNEIEALRTQHNKGPNHGEAYIPLPGATLPPPCALEHDGGKSHTRPSTSHRISETGIWHTTYNAHCDKETTGSEPVPILVACKGEQSYLGLALRGALSHVDDLQTRLPHVWQWAVRK